VTALRAVELFRQNGVHEVLVPGAGYGRNTKLFSSSGMRTIGVEISTEALALARDFDPQTIFHQGSALEVVFPDQSFDAIYCFNLLHLFREKDRKQLIERCRGFLRGGGLAYFVVFCERDSSYGKGAEVELNTFESKPGRPVHYFTEPELLEHFRAFEKIETGLTEDREDHGAEGPHRHTLRYIIAQRKP